jgi:16S rRNA (guanine(1405)-N(7))-methyltransferase
MTAAQGLVDDVVQAVRTSRRYQWVAPSVVTRLAAEEIPKARNAADAEKRTKRRLHQIFGAYAQPLPYSAIASRIESTITSADGAEVRAACEWVLGLHASTRERLLLLPQFYADVLALTGPPRRLLDVACGLNPFAWPWMGLDPADCSYAAFDIDTQLAPVLRRFFDGVGVTHEVGVVDALEPVALPAADVALVLKSVPCLEQQRAGAGLALLDRLDAPWLVVSYPTRSLGGHGKGMLRTYRSQFAALLAQRPSWRATELEHSTELVFVVAK